MNVLITLPRPLIDLIISGKKIYEMRKSVPRMMTLCADGFFVVEKATDIVRCWCRVDEIIEAYTDKNSIGLYAPGIGVPLEYIERYANRERIYLWKIGKVMVLQDLCRGSLFVDKNPQQFAYCPLSYGESY